MVLSAAGQTLTVPTYLAHAAGERSAGPAFIAICLPPPDVPAGTPGRATFGAKVYSAELTINGVFSTVASGRVDSILDAVQRQEPGTPNIAGTVASPAAIAPGAVTLTAKRSGLGRNVTGLVTQAGQPRGGATVTIVGGSGRRPGSRGSASAKVAANGKFAFKAKAGTFFRADAVAAGGAAPSVCTTIQPLLGRSRASTRR